MDIKLNFSSSKISGKDLLKSTAIAWKKSRKIIFLIIMLSFIFAGWNIWTKSISGSGWSQQRKQEFMDAQNKQVEFKEREFNKIKEEVESRQQKSAENLQELKDVFKNY